MHSCATEQRVDAQLIVNNHRVRLSIPVDYGMDVHIPAQHSSLAVGGRLATGNIRLINSLIIHTSCELLVQRVAADHVSDTFIAALKQAFG